MRPEQPIIRLTLTPEADLVPYGVRLRRCLKALLRRYSLRCLAVETMNMSDEGLGQTVIPFGKHKGRAFDDVDLPYLDWLIGKEWFEEKFPDLYRKACHYLKANDQELGRDQGEG